MATTTVRVTEQTRDALTRLSRARGVSTAEYLEELVSRRQQDELLARMNDAYAAQREDGQASRDERREREAWDETLLDGLAGL